MRRFWYRGGRLGGGYRAGRGSDRGTKSGVEIHRLLADLQHAPSDLIAFHADKQSAEVAIAKPLVAFTLNDLKKDRTDDGLRKYLQKISSIAAVEQYAATLQFRHRLPVAG